MNEQLWWYVARASGMVAWLFAIASILWGLALSTRALGKQPRAPWLLDLHRFLGGATIVLTLVHIGALIADSYVTFDVVDVLVPWASQWRTAAVAWGVIALWLLLAVQLSSMFMKRLPKRLWRGVHLSSYVVAILATVHGLAAGADAEHPAVVLAWPVASAAIIFFTAYRVFGPGRRGDVPAARPAASAAPAPATNDRRAAIEAAKQRAAAAKAERAAAPAEV